MVGWAVAGLCGSAHDIESLMSGRPAGRAGRRRRRRDGAIDVGWLPPVSLESETEAPTAKARRTAVAAQCRTAAAAPPATGTVAPTPHSEAVRVPAAC